ncbi:uncharacterized protein [Pleurodeles waltl]
MMVSDSIKEEEGAYAMADQCSEEVRNTLCPTEEFNTVMVSDSIKEEREALPIADPCSEEVKIASCPAEEEFNIVMVSDSIKEEREACPMTDQCSEDVKNTFCLAEQPKMTAQREASYVKSRTGKKLLKYAGYLYCKERLSEPRSHWRCVQYYSSHCTGRAVTLEDTVVRTTEHNHSASAMEIEVRENVQQIKLLAHASNEPCGSLLREVAQNIPAHVASSMPSIPNLRRMIQREKLASNPQRVTPQTYADINIPPQLTITFSNEPFLLYDNENPQKRILIFSTNHNLGILENSQVWMMDGTFKSTLHPFTQIYTILVNKSNTAVPLVYALLPDKHSSTYTEFLTIIKEKTMNKNPRKVILDFELTMINTITKLYPDTQIQGSFFHFSQAYWRKIQKSSLFEEYLSSSKLQYELRKLTALCFVPPDRVDEYYTTITESEFFIQNEDKLTQLLNYFEETWIGHLSRSGRRRKPRFHIELWNCYTTCLEGGAKTNNAIEEWHNSFSKSIGKRHPNLYNFMEVLKKEQSLQEMRLAQSLSGSLNPKVSKKSKEMSERLLGKMQQFLLMSPLDYLDSLAYILHF